MILGIDIGTSKTAAVVVGDDGATVGLAAKTHRADLPAAPGLSEQNPRALLDSAAAVVRELPRETRRSISGIGVTGQMHGVLVLDAKGEPLTPLVTWQDGRCAEGNFLEELHRRTGALLRTGYGCATLAWYTARSLLPGGAASAATIHDWIAAGLCGLAAPVTDPTDGASWGLFDIDALAWDLPAALAARIPRKLLPEVVPCGQVIGATTRAAAELFGIPAGIPVSAAIGDNQASLLATLHEPEKELSLTLGTGGQLSAVQPAGSRAIGLPADATWEQRPYPGPRLLAVAASLCGGSAWQWLVDTVERWQAELGLPAVARDDLFVRLNDLGAQAAGAQAPGARGQGEISVHPHFLGERHDPGRRGSIEGISLDNLSLGSLAHALAHGICANLRDMLPAHLREGRTRLVASGNALDRNPLLRRAAEEVFGMPVLMGAPREAAAVGAARLAAQAVRNGAGPAAQPFRGA
ncbi:MAG: FGGY family carbohydrate kinase [Spirochaetes bacterium]|nr:FGGY family carbohydrate kinase [Spirochaetota bacterium]